MTERDHGRGGGGIFDPGLAPEDRPADLERLPDERPAQVAAEVDATRYQQLGRLAMVPAADGGVTLDGSATPPELDVGLTRDNLVCTADRPSGRPPCSHYVAFLTDADGVFKGGKRQLMQIRRFCTRMSTASELMEIGSVPVHACTARSPIDQQSAKLIENFEREQRKRTEEATQTSADVDL
jgi:hypothetical protein